MGRSIEQMPPAMKKAMKLLPWPFIIVGAVTLFFGVRGVLHGRASMTWPTVEGKITASSVESRRVKRGRTYHAEIIYEYAVDGTKLNGSRVAYGDYGSNKRSHAQSIVNKYKKGQAVTVYYMHDNPKESLLEPGVKGQAWLLPGFGIIFFCSGIVAFVLLRILMKPRAVGPQSAAAAELWRVVDTSPPWKPDWTNGPDGAMDRWFGAGEAKPEIEGDILQCKIKRGGSRFALIFGLVFLPTMLAVIWFFVDDLKMRIVCCCGATLSCVTGIGIFYALLRHHENLGDNLVINRSLEKIYLPRQKLEFPFSQVVGFQWMSAPTGGHHRSRANDFNLLVRQSDSIVRYHVMSEPSRATVEKILCFSGFSLDEYKFDWFGDRGREYDANSA